MSNQGPISIPEAFQRFADEFCQEREQDITDAFQQEMARKEKAHLAEERRLREGIQFAEKIFEWANRFRSSEIFLQLLNVGGHTPYFVVRGLYFFDGNIAGVPWRGLGVSEAGIWWNIGGCGGSTPRYVKDPENLARQVDPLILEEACRWIEDGRVWECIQRRLEWGKRR